MKSFKALKMVDVGGDAAGGGSDSGAKLIANIFISFIGAGILGLPFAFKKAGILEGNDVRFWC